MTSKNSPSNEVTLLYKNSYRGNLDKDWTWKDGKNNNKRTGKSKEKSSEYEEGTRYID